VNPAGLSDGAEQAHHEQGQKAAFAGRQRQKIVSGYPGGRNQGMMVRHLAIVDYLINVTGKHSILPERQNFDSLFHKHPGTVFHMTGQIPAVGTGIAGQFLFVQALRIIQRLLRRIAQQTVSVPLQAGQIIKPGWLFQPFLLFQLDDSSFFSVAKRRNPFRFGALRQAFANSAQRAAVQLHCVKGSGLERLNLRFALHQQGQRRGHDPPNIQQLMIPRREQPRGVDPYQPVRLRAAQGRMIQRIIFAGRSEVAEPFGNRGVFQ